MSRLVLIATIAGCAAPGLAPEVQPGHTTRLSGTYVEYTPNGAPQCGADVDGDGYEDLVVRRSGYIDVWYGGTTAPTSPTSTTVSGSGAVRCLGDFDGDGYDDLLVDDGSGGFDIWEGSSSGLGSSKAGSRSSWADAVAAGDEDGDGYDDVWAQTGSNTVQLFRGSSSGLKSSAAYTFNPGLSSHDYARVTKAIFSLDYDDDGDIDLVMSGEWTSFHTTYSTGDGVWLLERGASSGVFSGRAIHEYAYNPGSDKYDIYQVIGMAPGAAASGRDGYVVMHEWDGSATWTSICNSSGCTMIAWDDLGGTPPIHVAGDFDGDGVGELVFTDTLMDDELLLVEGADSEAEESVDPFGITPLNAAAAVDFDGDGADTLVHQGASKLQFLDESPEEDADGDGHAASVDCNDDDATVHPGATEIWYDGIDQDCDGLSDFDQDGDSYDSEDYGGTDCDDTRSEHHPGAVEVWYDGVDANCDGRSDYDQDGDGQDHEDHGGTDCLDTDATAYLGAPEVWYDGVDQDCLGGNDYDQDGDGYVWVAAGGEDCVDDDARYFPGGPEVWYDGIDQDCLGDSDYDQDKDGFDAVEHGGTDCDDLERWTYPGAPDPVYDGIDSDCDRASDYDADGDGFDAVAFGGPDCDDADPSIHPRAEEIPGDEVDSDCDGGEICFVDADGDGFVVPGRVVESADPDCRDLGEAPVGTPAGDCNDGDRLTHPGAEEIVADEIDQDCDGGEICLADADGDGFPVLDATVVSPDLDCLDDGEGTRLDEIDCDDADPGVYPGADEQLADGVDQNCDGMDGALVKAPMSCSTSGSGGLPWLGLLPGLMLLIRRRR